MKNEVRSLNACILKLENASDDVDAVSRRSQVVLSDKDLPIENSNENVVQLVKQMFRNKLSLEHSDQQLISAQRIGPKSKSQGPDRRNILVSLENSETKINLLKTCKNVKPTFFANENLNPCRNTIMYALRKMKKTSSYWG